MIIQLYRKEDKVEGKVKKGERETINTESLLTF